MIQSHFCNLISERKTDALRIENFKVNSIGGIGGTCELHLIESGRKYSGTVDLQMDALRQTPLPMSSPSKQTSTDNRKPNTPLTTRYNIDFTESYSMSVQQVDNGTHLAVSVRQYIGKIMTKEEKRFTFSGDKRNLAAHSVVLGPDSWTGYLFFEDFQGKADREHVLVGMVSLCELIFCQFNGGPPLRQSADSYIEDLASARLLKIFLNNYTPYYVILRDDDSRMTIRKAKKSRISPQAMIGIQLFRRPPLGFMCRTNHDGLKVYLFDVQQAVVRVFAYQGLGSTGDASLPLKTVDFWRFFNCYQPGAAPARPSMCSCFVMFIYSSFNRYFFSLMKNQRKKTP